MYTEVVVNAVKKAGEILMKHYGKVETKLKSSEYDAGSIVTDADIEAESYIVGMIQKNFPGHGIFSEERGKISENEEFAWYIDPLDGTSNFIRNIPLFGISVGLVNKGRVIFGVLYFPALDLLISAEKGSGAYANGERVNVSKRPVSQALYWAGGKFKGKQQLVSSVAQKVGLVKIIDSSSYEFANIAMGNSEIYYLGNILHDVIAGICIVEEAGGKVTDGEGKPWRLTSEMVLVTNGVVHDEVLDILILNG